MGVVSSGFTDYVSLPSVLQFTSFSFSAQSVYHDIDSKFKRTTLRMKKQNEGVLDDSHKVSRKQKIWIDFKFVPSPCVCVPAGYGLHCHRAVITLCKLIGIKDMYCKVEGSVNLLNITKALFTGLANQVRSCDQCRGVLAFEEVAVFGSQEQIALHFLLVAGNPPEVCWQEAAPRGRVSGASRPAAPGGGESQRRSTILRGARGWGPQHAIALGWRTSVTGTQTLHLVERQTHHLVGSEGANEALRLWADWTETTLKPKTNPKNRKHTHLCRSCIL